MADKPKYFGFEPDAFLSDADFIMMDSEHRGAYFSIILYLYRNNGKLRNKPESLAKLCNCKSEVVIQTVLSKFQVRRGFVYHKRVSREIRRAQSKREQAVKAAMARWKKECFGNASASAAQCQAKRSEANEEKRSNNKAKGNTKQRAHNGSSLRQKIPSSVSLASHLQIYDNLCRQLQPISKSDEEAYRKLAQFLAFDSGRIDQAMTLAKEAKASKARNRIALFFSLLKKEMKYESNRLGTAAVGAL